MTNVEEIKSKLNIIEIIQEYLPLKQSGANFKGLCPFHTEKTPSFLVSQEKQFFKCFGCNEGGDMFTFLQKIENIEFPEALKILADKAGVQLRQVNYDPQMQNLKTRLYDLHKQAIKFYQDQFFNSPLGKSAREYLINTRGLNKDIIQEFQIGYTPESWDMISKHLHAKGFTENEIKQSGLVAEKNVSRNSTGFRSAQVARNYYDRFRDRIMFPIADHHGNVVGFTGRAMKDDPESSGAKYINTPQTVIYNKSQVLYGLYNAKSAIRENKFLILVEGNMDVIASCKAGIKNVIAASGTSLTLDQINILKRYSKNVAMCFDADAAGVVAAERGIDMLWQNEMNIKVIILPKDIKDPDELIQKSPDAWQEAIDKKINFMDYFLQVNTIGKNLNDIDVKKSVAGKIMPWITKLNNSVEQDHYLKKLANILDVTEKGLHDELQKLKSGRLNKRAPVRDMEPTQGPEIKKINKRQLVSQRLLALVMHDPNYTQELIDVLVPELIEESFQELYKTLIFYYTKNNELRVEDFYNYLKAEKNDLVFVFDTLKMLAESEFTELSSIELNKEFKLSVNWLLKESIMNKLKQIEKDIRNAEQSGDRTKADRLMREFSELSRELSGL